MQTQYTYFFKHALILFWLVPLYGVAQRGHVAWIDSLSDLAYSYNKQGEFDKSIQLYNNAIKSDTVTAFHRYYIYLYKSFTYKWLGDYISVERNLQLAKQAADKTKFANKLNADIRIELATMYFDILAYPKADSVMKLIRANGFDEILPYNKALILMQEAYLLFLNKQYEQVEALYKESISLMESEDSNCNTPIVYWKLQAYYLSQGKKTEAEWAINEGLRIAKMCNVDKYVMFTYAEAAIHYAMAGDYKRAFAYSLQHDSTKEAINNKEHLEKIAELEKEYQSERETEKQQLAKKNLEAQTNFNYLLASVLVSVLLLCILIYAWLNYRKSKRYRTLKNRFTSNLFASIEQERERIATDLHDGISHELLNISREAKSHLMQEKINLVIQEIRFISRNLHPILFDKLGLNLSIDQLANRLQENTGIVITTEFDYKNGCETNCELQLYRIAQEALSNAIKHSNAYAIRIGLFENDKAVELHIQDNGVGFDAKANLLNVKAFGLQSILQRSEAIGGQANIKSGNWGTHIIVTVP